MKINNEFGKRPLQNKKKLKQYFLIFEGSKTEINYFNSVIKYKKAIGINDLVTIYPLERDKKDTTKSNPYKILFELCKNIKQDIENEVDYYDNKIDKICLIFDRDKRSFKEWQYNKVKEECENQEYKLYISNPHFELWLLFHFDISDVNHEDINNNAKMKGKNKDFIKQTLKSKNKSYNKSKTNFENFMNNINTALSNAKKFSISIEDLKDNKGSNIGLLFEEWRDIKK